MPYTVRILPWARQQIAAWSLGDVLPDVYLRLDRDLRSNPAQQLRRLRQPIDGMAFIFSLVDPMNRLREHRFLFQVVYGQDEETLFVPRGIYAMRDGG